MNKSFVFVWICYVLNNKNGSDETEMFVVSML